MARFLAFLLVTLVAATPAISRGEDTAEVKQLKDRIALLEAELRIAKQDNEALKKKVEEIDDTTKVQPRADSLAAEKPIIAPLGSVWEGKFGPQSGKMSVVAREGKNVTFLIEAENGAKWEFDCEFFRATQYKINVTRRLQAADGVQVQDLDPVGGVTGKGNVSGKKLVHSFRWERKEKKSLDLRFIGTLSETSE